VQPADVAIVGLACRFPGAADPAGFWCVIRDGLEVTRAPGEDARRRPERVGSEKGCWTTSPNSTLISSTYRHTRPAPWIPAATGARTNVGTA